MQLIAAGKMVHLAPTRITAHVRARTGRPFNALDNPLRRLRDPGSHTLTAPLKPAGRAMTRLLPPSIRTDISRDANRHREQAHDVSMSLSSVYREVRQVRITSAGQEKQAHNRTAPSAPLVALGEKLFNDKRLSVDDTVACATCHDPAKGFVDHRDNKPTSAGVQDQHGQRNAPTVLNAMFQASQFWDGRAPTLEDQAKLPILNPVEMAQKSPADVVAKVAKIPEYSEAFKALFGHDLTYDDIAAAIAAFERIQYSGNSPFDRFLAGDPQAISEQAKRGWALFQGKGRCSNCHAFNSISPLFSDQKFHNIGIAAHKQNFAELARKALAILKTGDVQQIDELALQTEYSELGRFLVTKNPGDIGAFKSETLRNIGITAPYMHDGSLATLWDVMDHYNKGGVPNPFLDGGMQRLAL